MEASLAACVLAALLATGACLQCEVCVAQGTNCTGSVETCAAGEDSCAFILTESTALGMTIQIICKSCVTSSQCNVGPISMNFGNGITSRTIVTCCVGDACKTVNVTLPPADTKPNGLHCPACYSVTTEQCREGTTECTGNETRCIDTAGTITTGGSPEKMVMKGCVSESMCPPLNVGAGTFAGVRWNLTTDKCTVANGAAAPGPAGILLLALAGLLLLKLLS